jgi:DNA-binding transcriptional LysR family regulator
MDWALLREEPLVVLVPTALKNEDPIELLRREPFLRYDRALGGGKQADRYLRGHGIAPKERFELSSLLAIAMMVHEGLGVSLVPDIESPLTMGLNVARIPLKDLLEPRRFGILWRRGSSRSRLIAAFLDQTQSA